MKGGWQKVVFAYELKPCKVCQEELWCEKHNMHYWECSCIGPTQDNAEYKEIDGVLYGRLIEEE